MSGGKSGLRRLLEFCARPETVSDERKRWIVNAESYVHALQSPGLPRIGECDHVRHLRTVRLDVRAIGPNRYEVTCEVEHIKHYVIDSAMRVYDQNVRQVARLHSWEDWKW